MLPSDFSQLVVYFTLYSFVGWLCESIWCSVAAKKWVNRGFLNGPFCPIYGFGGLLILLVSDPLIQYPPLVFLAAALAVSLLEYFTGWLLESLFQMRWWDYSNRRFNLKGRVCLRNSLLFGVMGLGVTYLLHPNLSKVVNRIPPDWLRLVSTLLVAVFIFDLLHTLLHITRLKERMAGLRDFLSTLDHYNKEYDWYERKDLGSSFEHLRGLLIKDQDNPKSAELLGQLDELDTWWSGVSRVKENRATRRLLRAFPSLKLQDWEEEVEMLRDNWQKRGDSFVTRLKSFCKEGWDSIWQQTKLTYREITASRIVWVFFIGCVIGYVVETIYCVLVTGSIESRQGMVYGPFSQVYGMGAVLLLLALMPFAKKNNFWLFLGGAVVGGLFEALCSLVQEVMFGTVSWQYAEGIPLLGGRTSVLYMFFWGVLGVVYMRFIYPAIGGLFDRLARRQQRFFAVIIAVLLGTDLLLSGLAVLRWVERDAGHPPSNTISRILDDRFPDERMKEIYPNMEIVPD